MTKPIALYFGCLGDKGHHLFAPGRNTLPERLWPEMDYMKGFPWTLTEIDCKLLENGKHPQIRDGKVFWTYSGPAHDTSGWFAFYWWDGSVDDRPGSNSGLYIQGFTFKDIVPAFQYAVDEWHEVVSRQPTALKLQIMWYHQNKPLPKNYACGECAKFEFCQYSDTKPNADDDAVLFPCYQD
jgi:hypothetical protein